MEHIDAIRIGYKYRGDRSFYIVVSEKEIMASVPPGSTYLNAVLTALTRMTSIALQEGIPRERVKKQLAASSIQKGDLPDLILRSMEEWEKR